MSQSLCEYQFFKTPRCRLRLRTDGSIQELEIRDGSCWVPVGFRSDEYSGPSWHVLWHGKHREVRLNADPNRPACFMGAQEDALFSLEYREIDGNLAMIAGLKNLGRTAFRPVTCGVRMGIDTYMAEYPGWNYKYFPTLLRCEKTHFWGYLMSPIGRILALASPDPIASWSMNYNLVWYGDEKHFGHRIYTVNLDLVNALPLPERHPQDRYEIRAGESREWIIYWAPLKDLAQVKPTISAMISAPVLELERHTLFSGETTDLTVRGRQEVTVELFSPSGERRTIPCKKAHDARRVFTIGSLEGLGVHTIQVTAENGKRSEAKVYVRRPWSWYLRQARREAVAKPQKAQACFEEWVGCFTAFLARKYFPEPRWDKPAEDNFRMVLSQVFDIEKAEPRVMPERIQNTAAMIALLADVHEVTGNLADLELASRLGDWLMTRQNGAGAYVGRCHYTSVTYIAKYMLELAVREKTLEHDPVWRERYRRHYASAKAAIDDLEKSRDNIETEGEITFEDGMISCTALQLGYFALMQNHPAARRKYAEAAHDVLTKHRCLQQLLIPDCRMNGATLRFWEAQYDVQIKKNMFNSPHAWTSWKTYATWYLYLLTGQEELLRQTMDTMGACMQVMDVQAGRLRWGFVPDPFVCAERLDPDPAHPEKGIGRETIIGEQYLELLRGGNSDVHEHFKCLEETVLTSAYVLERKTGEMVAWNCRVEAADDAIRVYPYEEIVSAVHVNLRQSHRLKIYLDLDEPIAVRIRGLKWVRRDEA